ncbi:hypothetical protein JXB37_06755 [candidate division WOR-3 bacterium]|nr:hypothetical protein [candidate division WOR-3 bacterium]
MTGTTTTIARPGLLAPWWQPVSIGPKFDWLDHDRIRVNEGRFAGAEFGVATEVRGDRAACRLDSGVRRVGQCLVERDPPGKGIVLWDTGVRPEFRRGGLCAVMAWILLRELVPVQHETSFRVRMITSVSAGDDTGLRNVGICVVANRLGLTGDYRAADLLAPANINAVRVLPARYDQPPGLLVTTRTYPLSIVAFALDPDTSRPLGTTRVYDEMVRDHRLAREWAGRGHLVISNGDWSLREDGIERFLCALALDEQEAADLRPRVRPCPEPGSKPRRRPLLRLGRSRAGARS